MRILGGRDRHATAAAFVLGASVVLLPAGSDLGAQAVRGGLERVRAAIGFDKSVPRVDALVMKGRVRARNQVYQADNPATPEFLESAVEHTMVRSARAFIKRQTIGGGAIVTVSVLRGDEAFSVTNGTRQPMHTAVMESYQREMAHLYLISLVETDTMLALKPQQDGTGFVFVGIEPPVRMELDAQSLMPTKLLYEMTVQSRLGSEPKPPTAKYELRIEERRRVGPLLLPSKLRLLRNGVFESETVFDSIQIDPKVDLTAVR